MSKDVAKGAPLIIHYQAGDHLVDFTLDPSSKTVWATQAQIADLFGVLAKTVGEHLRNIFIRVSLIPI